MSSGVRVSLSGFESPLLVLAPMEGLTDASMRAVLTRLGHYDWCVTEFLRVVDRLLPVRSFYAVCPELHHGARTPAGTPVHLQLLGSDPQVMAENAARAAALGAPAIDLNFGCPAKIVNRHGGGAALLDTPEQVHAIVSAVRRAVPPGVPVSAKMRLGFNDRSYMLDNALAIEAAGASWLTVHARTKVDGYKPPAHWEAIAEIGQRVHLPLLANGEIWRREDALRCRQRSGCVHLMLGRGAVSRPDLVDCVRGGSSDLNWARMVPAQLAFIDSLPFTEAGNTGRYKQWLGLLSRGYREAAELFQQVKKMRSMADIRAALLASIDNAV